MNDAEINLAIAKLEYPDCDFEQGSRTAICRYSSGEIAFQRDYCKNWADIGTIIERERISVSVWGNQWKAVCPNENHHIFSETPMKAAALCFLKMRESE